MPTDTTRPSLRRVVYELFVSDLVEVDDPACAEAHTIDRELRLDWDDGSATFVSWTSRPVMYCIGAQPTSFFLPNDEAVTRDMSASALWAPLIGRPAALRFCDDDHQVLAVGDGRATVYCAAYEQGAWRCDVVRICAAPPLG